MDDGDYTVCEPYDAGHKPKGLKFNLKNNNQMLIKVLNWLPCKSLFCHCIVYLLHSYILENESLYLNYSVKIISATGEVFPFVCQKRRKGFLLY